LVGEPEEKQPLETISIDERLTFKLISIYRRNQDIRKWTGVIWLRIEASGEL
jgi:hypothetical protein